MKKAGTICIINYQTSLLRFMLLGLLLGFFSFWSLGQTTIRFQQNLNGGLATAANSLQFDVGVYSDIDGDTSTSASSSADLVLPPGSQIYKAFLYIENFDGGQMTTVKFAYPGSTGYTTLTTASPQFLANPDNIQSQLIFDVTNIIPINGFTSNIVNGGDPTGAGRYMVADPNSSSVNSGLGWSLVVVYRNPASAYRSLTIADACTTFGFSSFGSISTIVSGITVPVIGPVNASVFTTGTYGDYSSAPLNTFPDYVRFGVQGGGLTNLADPVTGGTNDILNSTIGIAGYHNVIADGLPIPTGNVTTRNPYNGFTGTSYNNTSYFYDADWMNASNILPNSATPINVEIRFGIPATSTDYLGVGAFGVAIDLAAPELTKSLFPDTMSCGGLSTYTFAVDNNVAGAINQGGLGFTDNLPAGIKIAPVPNVTVTNASTAPTVTANPGASVISVSNLGVLAGDTAFITVDITNEVDYYNLSCATNPNNFTNGFFNVITTGLLSNKIQPQCLLVHRIPSTLDSLGPFCVGQTPPALPPTSLEGYPGTWFPNSINTSIAQGRYYVFTPDDACYAPDSIYINVTPGPTINFTPSPANVCAGDSITLSGNPTGGSGVYASHSWTGTGAANLNDANSATPLFYGNTVGSSTLTYTVQDAAGCSVSQNITVTTNARPTASILPDPAVLCAGTSLNMDGNPSGGSNVYSTHNWTGSGAGNLSSTSIRTPVFTGASVGNFVLVYNVTDNQGCSNTDSMTVVVNPGPTITLSPAPPSVCNGTDGQITVNGIGTGNVSWTGTATGSSAGVTLPFVIPNLSPGSYNVQFTSAAGCSSPVVQTIINNPAGITINGIPDTSACNIPYTLNTNIITGSNLSGNQGFYYSTGGVNPIPNGTVLPVGTDTNIYVYDNDGSCPAEIVFHVSVFANPTASISPDPASVCAGLNLSLTGTPGGGEAPYQNTWLGTGSGSLSNTNTATTVFNNASAGSYQLIYRVTDNNGCRATDTIQVANNALPSAAISPDPIVLCAGDTVAVNGNPTGGSGTYTTHTWSGTAAGFLVNNTTASEQLTSNSAGTYQLNYQVTDNQGCTRSDSVAVTVNAIPNITLTPTNPTSCSSNNGFITVNSSVTNGTVIWSGTTSGNSGNVNLPVNIPNLQAGTYMVYLQTLQGCTSETDTATLINPSQPFIDPWSDTSMCGGSYFIPNESEITGNNLTGNQAFYSQSGGNPAAQLPAGTLINASQTPYTVYVYDQNGSCNYEDTFVVYIHSNPVVNAVNSSPICAGNDPITLSETGGDLTSWNWTSSGAATFDDPTLQNPNASNVSDQETFTVTGTDVNGCSGSATTTVTVHPLPVVSFTADDTVGCVPHLVTFTEGATLPGATCIWNFGDGTVLNQCGTVNNTYNAAGLYDVSLTVISAQGCIDSMVRTNYISVEEAPIADFSLSNTTIDAENTEVLITNNSQFASSYTWNFGDGSPINTDANPVHDFPQNTGSTYEVVLTAFSPSGCSSTFSMFVTSEKLVVEELYYVPNAFTPDDDAFNPTFRPIITSGFDLSSMIFRVYNRWGELIFESKDPNVGWDGTFNNLPMQEGAYTWTLELLHIETDQRYVFNGLVNLLR
ncbi:MAG: PKD domain-containing protein [Crocinitomicaceae bacterium]|nr:PKD domain-containing protein [Crocinitomicaceae bacterium]